MPDVKETETNEKTEPRYKIEYDPKLTEEIVSQEIKNLESEGKMRMPDAFRAATDPIYDQYPLADRDDIGFEDAFRDVYKKFFKILGYDDILRSALSEYPVIDEHVGQIVVKICYAEEKEEANLLKTKIEDPERGSLSMVSLQVTSGRFADKEALALFLRHELMHVTDMLDPEFSYEITKLGINPSEECTIKNHYALIWDIYIDQRLVRSERLDPSYKEKRKEEFDSTYRSLPFDERISIFEGLWQVERLTNPEILACAKDPARLLEYRAALSPEEIERQKTEKKKKIHLPGMICPLCKFPTHKWKEEESLLKEVIEEVSKDAPGWDPSDGLCERCDEVYRAIVGKW